MTEAFTPSVQVANHLSQGLFEYIPITYRYRYNSYVMKWIQATYTARYLCICAFTE